MNRAATGNMWVSSTANPSEYPVTRRAKLKNFKGPLVMVSITEEQEDEPGANSFTLSADFRPVFPTPLSPFVLPTILGPSPTTSVFGTRQAFIDELLAISSPWHVAGFTFVLSTRSTHRYYELKIRCYTYVAFNHTNSISRCLLF
ncbi:hypothetical protein ACKLNR_000248 [Fusarium oxysporum f. sp. zingiberi]